MVHSFPTRRSSDLPVLECRNLTGVIVNTSDLMAEISETCPGNKADIARPNHRNAHELPEYERLDARNQDLRRPNALAS